MGRVTSVGEQNTPATRERRVREGIKEWEATTRMKKQLKSVESL
jgi:hypothetical protein